MAPVFLTCPRLHAVTRGKIAENAPGALRRLDLTLARKVTESDRK